METIESIPSFILDATEIVESVFQFRSKKVFIFLKSQQSLELLLPDLLFLQSSEISFSIVQQVDEDASLKSYKAYNLESSSFFLGANDEKTREACRQSFLDGSNNLYHLFYLRIPKDCIDEQETLRYVFSLGQHLKPWKMIFFFQSFFDRDGNKISHQKTQELSPEQSQSKKPKKACVAADATQQKFLQSLEKLAPSLTSDVVSLDFKVGALFYELFTLAGSGTLFSATYSAKVRSAAVKDLAAIIRLINAPMAENRLTQIDWFTLQANLQNGFVYAIDHSIVGFAMLNVYENLGELAKFATFPRYQGRGIAKELAFALIQKAKELNLEGVFALSIDPKMGDFFQTIGFIEHPREKLPLSWQKNYDFNRPSKAFLLSFSESKSA